MILKELNNYMMTRNILLVCIIFYLGCGGGSDPVVYVPPVEGCMDETACNYNPEAEVDSEDEQLACNYDACVGCTDETACNYNELADTDDGTCDFESCSGCMTETACNYNADATIDDGSCYSTVDALAQLIDGGVSQTESACLMLEDTIYITSTGTVLYNLSQDNYGFEFDLSGVTISDVSGGDAAQSGLTVQTGNGNLPGTVKVIGYSLSFDFIPAGCGILTELTLNGSVTQVDDVVFSNQSGESINVSDLSGCDCNLASALDCTGTCGGDDLSCADCEGVFNGTAALDCAGTCGGTAFTDCPAAVGDCIPSQEACNDLVAIQALIDLNSNLAATNPTPQSLFNDNLIGKNSDDRVTWIQISGKEIIAIPSQISDLTELVLLDLSYNNLGNSIWNIASLSKLTSLNLSFNPGITEINSSITTNLVMLNSLNLDGNNITSLPSLAGLINLETLDIGTNGLTELPSLPISLQRIYADQNSLTSIPSSIGSLNYIDVSNNQLTSLPGEICNTISTLNISGNQICPITDFQESGQYYNCSSNLGIGLVGVDQQNCR